MPKQIPQIPGVEISGSWRPARIVGGDYFDVLVLVKGEWAFASRMSPARECQPLC
jgi:serine phosphatase RsbU (regulator of sigma subunit)